MLKFCGEINFRHRRLIILVKKLNLSSTIFLPVAMPLYEYECKNCGYNFEQLQTVSAKPLRACPQCAADQLVKLISTTSFQLKGTGWYVTDFKNKKPKKEQEKTNPAPKKDEKK